MLLASLRCVRSTNWTALQPNTDVYLTVSIQYTSELDDKINRNEELPAGLQECEIRAAAIVAGDQIVAESKGRMTTLDLDAYLWRVGMYSPSKAGPFIECDSHSHYIGKEPHLRVLERHATKDTFFY